MEAAIGQVREQYAFTQRGACGLMLLALSTYRYQSRPLHFFPRCLCPLYL